MEPASLTVYRSQLCDDGTGDFGLSLLVVMHQLVGPWSIQSFRAVEHEKVLGWVENGITVEQLQLRDSNLLKEEQQFHEAWKAGCYGKRWLARDTKGPQRACFKKEPLAHHQMMRIVTPISPQQMGECPIHPSLCTRT